jgi:hypothetical protein
VTLFGFRFWYLSNANRDLYYERRSLFERIMSCAIFARMDLFLYHTQSLFYYSILGLLLARLLLNAVIYYKIDSDVIQADIPDHWTMISFSENEKADIRKSRPEIKDFRQDGGGHIYKTILFFAFTFWWPAEYSEQPLIKKLKRLANILNIAFILMAVVAVFLFINMQGINARYSNVQKNCLYFLR